MYVQCNIYHLVLVLMARLGESSRFRPHNYRREVSLIAVLIAACHVSSVGVAQEVPPPPFADTASDVYGFAEMMAQHLELMLGGEPTRHVFVKSFDQGNERNLGVSNAIARALKARGFQVDENAPYYLTGGLFAELREAQASTYSYRVRAKLVTVETGEERPVDFIVENETEALAFLGRTEQLLDPPRTSEYSSPDYDTTAVTHIVMDNDFWVRPSPHSGYAVGLRVKDPDGRYRPVRPELTDGVVEVRFQKGQVYRLELWNSTLYEAGASVFIDGLSRYAVADDPAKRGLIDILPAYNSTSLGIRVIPGYFKNVDQQYEFRVVDQDSSLARQLLPTELEEMGSIAVVFRAVWPDGHDPPPHERKKMEEEVITTERYVTDTVIDPATGRQRTIRRPVMEQRSVTREIVGTGPGDVITDRTRIVRRNLGFPREVVRIRYFATR